MAHELHVCYVQLQAAVWALGMDTAQLGDGALSFPQLGGDGLAATYFVQEVDERCGTMLGLAFVLDRSHRMRDIADQVCLVFIW